MVSTRNAKLLHWYGSSLDGTMRNKRKISHAIWGGWQFWAFVREPSGIGKRL